MSSGLADDLPRTLRRERELRERGIDRNGRGPATSAPFVAQPTGFADAPLSADVQRDGVVMQGTTVTDIRIPFTRLMAFCFKFVLASVPALIMLGCILWAAGHLLMIYAPWLVKMQILIRVP